MKPLSIFDEPTPSDQNLRLRLLGGLGQDFTSAFRAIRRQPGFAVVAIVILALGIGTTAAIVEVADRVLLRPVLWPDAHRLVRLEERRAGQSGSARWSLTNGTYNAWQQSSDTLDEIGGWMSSPQLLKSEPSERLVVTTLTPSVFRLLRARAAVGRLFADQDADVGRDGTVILSHGIWQERFGSDVNVLGRVIQIDDRMHEIIGVMPKSFVFPDRNTRVWVPFRPLPLMSGDGRQMRVIVVNAIARLRDRVTPSQAAAEGTSRARGVPDIQQAALTVFGARGEVSVSVARLAEVLTADVRPAMLFFSSPSSYFWRRRLATS